MLVAQTEIKEEKAKICTQHSYELTHECFKLREKKNAATAIISFLHLNLQARATGLRDL